MDQKALRSFLGAKVRLYNQPSFIGDDPVCIPHRCSKKQDVEIMGFFAAVFAWGQRITIINKCTELSERMDHDPYGFVTGHSDNDLKKLLGFKHRTFNETDLLYFISFFRYWYTDHESLEQAFSRHIPKKAADITEALNGFRRIFFGHTSALSRTYRHIASPEMNSACKRLNMFLRWMVRNDGKGVDFGIWNEIRPAQLMCPLDVHVHRVALRLGLMERTQPDWKAVVELTASLRTLDATDPVKYDFALFGIGVGER